MFDLASSKLVILAIVALLVVGPKDLPILLRAAGKYLGVIRRYADGFRSHLDEMIAEVEMQEHRKLLQSVSDDVTSTVREGGDVIGREIEAARRGVDGALREVRRELSPPAAYRLYPQAADDTPHDDDGSKQEKGSQVS